MILEIDLRMCNVFLREKGKVKIKDITKSGIRAIVTDLPTILQTFIFIIRILMLFKIELGANFKPYKYL